jgi:serine/threonine-protein kinase
MGEVYRGLHLELETQVALKFLSEGLQGRASAVHRFRREARAAAGLKSPHIVQVIDFGIDGELPFLVMELLRGESLAARVKRFGRLDFETTAIWLEQAARGLAVAHRQGIVHRDVKPSNLFIAREGRGETLKLLDFGLAKGEEVDDGDGTLTDSRVVLGSPRYMSPEQASGDPVDARSDVWALAAVTFRMLTGCDAFSARSNNQVFAAIRAGAAPLASSVAPGLPKEADSFFAKAFARAPEERFQSVEQLSRAFALLRSADWCGRSLPALNDLDRMGRPLAAASNLGDTRSPSSPSLVRDNKPHAESTARPRLRFGPLALVALAVAAGVVFANRVREAASASDSGPPQSPQAAPPLEVAGSKPADSARQLESPASSPGTPSVAASAAPARSPSRRPSRASQSPSAKSEPPDPLFGL